MGTPTTPLFIYPGFTTGSVLMSRDILTSWLPVINYLLPLTSNVLNGELESIQSQLSTLINATPNPTINSTLIVVPISLIISSQFALANFNYQNGGPFSLPSYTGMVNDLDNVFNQYSRGYFSNAPGTLIIVS